MEPKTTFGDTLRFTAYAWAKLIWMRDRGETEVAGYAITGTEDPLLVTDFVLVKQKCTEVTFDLDPEDGVEHAERMMDAGFMPWQTQNILCHSHPSNCPRPSLTDEENFKSAFSHPNWAIMFIIAKGGQTYCRLKINTAPGVIKLLKIEVDYSVPFEGSKEDEWNTEYTEKVTKDDNWSRYTLTEDSDKKIEEDEVDCYWGDDSRVVYNDYTEGIMYEFDSITGDWYAMGDDEDELQPTDAPNTQWAKKVIEWAEENSEEREDEICQNLST